MVKGGMCRIECRHVKSVTTYGRQHLQISKMNLRKTIHCQLDFSKLMYLFQDVFT